MGKKLQLPESELIDLYLQGFSLREIAKIYCTDKDLIKRRLIQNNIKLRSLSEANRIYSFDENVFQTIDSHEKAYWLGFFAADGSIYKNIIKIGLSYDDLNHLEKFKNFLKSEHPIKETFPKVKGKIYHACAFNVHSDKLIYDLNKLNIFNNKSQTLKPAELNPKYYSSYILGLIDGDGGFSVDKKLQLKMYLINSIYICQFVMDTLHNACGIETTKIIPEKRSDGMNYCYFGGNNKCKLIANYLYNDCPIFLERKKNIVDNHLLLVKEIFSQGKQLKDFYRK